MTIHLAAGLPGTHGDRLELSQVLLNLISNAIDATQSRLPGSARIEISTVCSDDNIEVAVRDNGIGLASVNLQQLFKLSYTTKPTGTGIGLSLCRSIIQAHGGRVWAEQNSGPGATFRFSLPCEAPALEGTVAAPQGRADEITREAAEVVVREKVFWG